MAKVRVYELAREFDMESKKLVERLVAGGMDIKNYMSTLDEDAVARAKDIINGAVSEVIEEQRIKPTVIRRRRKKIRVEPEPTPEEVPAAEPEAPAGEAVAAEGAAPQISDLEEEAQEVTPPERPEEPRREEEAQGGEAFVEGEEGLAPPETAGEAGAKEAESPSEAEEAVPAPKEEKPKRKKPRKGADEPAKIIRRPEEGPLKDLLARRKERPAPLPGLPGERKPVPPTPIDIAKDVALEAGKEKPKKRKKGKKAAVKEDARPAGKSRKREVFERADLFEDRPARMKGKKGARGRKEAARKRKHTELTTPKAIKRRIKVEETVVVNELARGMGVKAVELIKVLLQMGVRVNLNQSIDFETASLVADEFGFELELDSFQETALLAEEHDSPESLRPRPPVVTIMGHVDHGKTSLLDYIRSSNIIGGESGGITQHIGAYYVKTDGGDIVFLDTPGHEAFTAMRARGAKVTDLIVLVVAADDGVMPQTREAINHARAADIPIVVAVNKIDKAEADPERVKRELAELGLSPEEWGGDTIFGNVSAKTGEGVEDLLGLILLQAEMLELKANPDKPARGTIIEARLDKSKGSVATVLIKSGTLKRGDYFVCGQHYGRVRAMTNHRGKPMTSAGPSMPVEIHGISGVPMAGDEFVVVKDEKTAKQVVSHRVAASRKLEGGQKGAVSLNDFFDRIKEGEVKELNIVLKADVQGSLEALLDSLNKLSTDAVKLKVIHAATGAITESDVMLASASGAIIIGFNVRANPRVMDVAEREQIDVRYYNVIYNALQDVRSAMAGLLEPVYQETVIGRADIKEIFHIPKVGAVAGCYVTHGHVLRNARVRVLRDEVVVFDGKISSLRRFKDDVKEVQSGYECGIAVEKFQDLKPGDVFEVYEVEEVEAEF
ncbi:MAG: translation initiation factor IF-2 [Deltaproteobacteria bacterium]|nr:translation initiation factor IF-2 [Deltaproteobacteria bacterium]MBW1924236.1 translation initiation factor IF-2 [Deltaproteobacteria bacterium]MBW1949209.1 translation initiation factor IF-2 [Deltaproteobacteria bacterium]MBW2007184.1 translation initiation factor IF-2 [Deltaproteobacteria bacterium]MBW2346547.1 translation initiation factor IF-2 [Deltaproteobacteria bacterium]